MAQLTKKARIEAFVRLLEDRPLDQITVRDIVTECGVSRNTFYYHFGDVYALLEALLSQKMDQLLRERREGESGVVGLKRLFGYVARHQRIANHIYSSINPAVLEHYLFQTTRELFMFVGMLMEWTRQGMRSDPAELLEKAQRLFLRHTRRMLEDSGREQI